jgi:large subunit ribosomal protein L29
MKKRDLKELRVKKAEEIEKMVSDRKGELIKLAIKVKSGEEKNLKKMKNIREEVARLLTIRKEKELIEKEAEKEIKVEEK